MLDSIYLVGAYRLEPGEGLFRGDKRIPLPPKELELLSLLVSLEGRVASRQDIEAMLWPRQIVGYASLARCVYSLRKLLDAEGENYIQTVPKRGYRIAAPLKKESIGQTNSAWSEATHTTPLAYAHFLQGLREANNPDADSQERSIHWYEEALNVDPQFASAHAAIAEVRVWQVIRGYTMPKEGLQLARSACEQALEINPLLVPALATQAWIAGVVDGDPCEGLAMLDEALAHDPHYARGYTYRSLLLRIMGRAEETLEAIRHAVDLDPHSIMNRHSLAWALFCCGRTEEALAVEHELRVAHPDDDIVLTYTAVFEVHLGHFEEALDVTFEALRLSHNNPAVQAMVAYVLAVTGETEDARALAQQAESARLPRAPRVFLAAAYLALGDRSYALDLLEQAQSECCVWLPLARMDPRLVPLADEPRFLALLFDGGPGARASGG